MAWSTWPGTGRRPTTARAGSRATCPSRSTRRAARRRPSSRDVAGRPTVGVAVVQPARRARARRPTSSPGASASSRARTRASPRPHTGDWTGPPFADVQRRGPRRLRGVRGRPRGLPLPRRRVLRRAPRARGRRPARRPRDAGRAAGARRLPRRLDPPGARGRARRRERARPRDPQRRAGGACDAGVAAGIFAVLVVATFARVLRRPAPEERALARAGVPAPTRSSRPTRTAAMDRARVSFLLKRGRRRDGRPSSTATATRCASSLDDRHVDGLPRRSALRGTGATTTAARARRPLPLPHHAAADQGRSVIVPRVACASTRRRRGPRVLSIGPERAVPRPELLPRRGGGERDDPLPGARAAGSRSRSSSSRPGARAVRRRAPAVATAPRSARWDGRLRRGRAASPGTYVVGVETRDGAGNIGRSPRARRRAACPRPATASGSRASGGITVRYLGAAPPATPTRRRRAARRFGVDARGERFRWRIRRVGAARVARGAAPHARRPAARARAGHDVGRLPVRGHHAPPRARRCRSPSRARAAARRARRAAGHDLAGPQPGRRRRRRRARTCSTAASASGWTASTRGDGLPAGFAEREAPLLAWLARTRRALRRDDRRRAWRRNRGPRLEGHQRRPAARRRALADRAACSSACGASCAAAGAWPRWASTRCAARSA